MELFIIFIKSGICLKLFYDELLKKIFCVIQFNHVLVIVIIILNFVKIQFNSIVNIFLYIYIYTIYTYISYVYESFQMHIHYTVYFYNFN